LVDEEDIDDDDGAAAKTGEYPTDDVTLNTPNPANNPDEEDMDDVIGRTRGNNALEGSVTEEDPPENMFGDDDDDEINPEPARNDEQVPIF
jgi:hypothetical protein